MQWYFIFGTSLLVMVDDILWMARYIWEDTTRIPRLDGRYEAWRITYEADDRQPRDMNIAGIRALVYRIEVGVLLFIVMFILGIIPWICGLRHYVMLVWLGYIARSFIAFALHSVFFCFWLRNFKHVKAKLFALPEQARKLARVDKLTLSTAPHPVVDAADKLNELITEIRDNETTRDWIAYRTGSLLLFMWLLFQNSYLVVWWLSNRNIGV